jgi:hypothetical protein
LNDSVALSSLENFQSTYKGYYIQASIAGGNGAIFKCDLDDPVSGLHVYYRQDNVDKEFRFLFNGSQAVRFNTAYASPVAGSAFAKQAQGDTTGGATNLFLQGMGFASAKINMPFLRHYGDTFNVAVNRAEVVFYLDSDLMPNYQPPPSLALLPITATGADTLSYDQFNATDNARYNGQYDETGKRYVFDISRHAQAIFRGDVPNLGFRLYVADPERFKASLRDNFIQRAILHGASGGDKRPRLNLHVVRLRD